jgi:hypothetical protein
VHVSEPGFGQCCLGILFTWIYMLDIGIVYYLSSLYFRKSIYLNQMHTQGFINLKRYTCS